MQPAWGSAPSSTPLSVSFLHAAVTRYAAVTRSRRRVPAYEEGQEVAADTVPEAEGEGSEEESDMVVQ